MKLRELLQHYAGKSCQTDVSELKKPADINSVSTVLEISPQLFNDLPVDIFEWPEYWLEAYEERAAIIEYDGGLSRHEAEKQAERLLRKEYKLVKR